MVAGVADYRPSMNKVSTLAFELRNPRFVARRLQGRPLMEVGLEELAPYLPDSPTILEAGACDGSDTVRLARRWPAGTVHAFEPVPDAYSVVVEATKALTNVSTHPLALSDRSGTAELNLSEDEDGEPRPDASSLLEPTGHMAAWPSIIFRRTVTVPTVTLDDWARAQSISGVDLMWLDLQGMELRVLNASPELLARTTAIYMEVWRRQMYDGAPTYDEVVDWAEARGFRRAIDRVHRVYGNVLFVRR
jgi:FkbM family methyltransferase